MSTGFLGWVAGQEGGAPTNRKGSRCGRDELGHGHVELQIQYVQN